MASGVLCAFCGHGQDVQNVCGKLYSHESELSYNSLAAHKKCMQYSAKLVQYFSPKYKDFGGFRISEVRNEIYRGKRLKCHWCKQAKKRSTGATAGCEQKNCKKSFHFYCARMHPESVTSRRRNAEGSDLYWVFCSEQHKKDYLTTEKGKQELSCNETDEEEEPDENVKDAVEKTIDNSAKRVSAVENAEVIEISDSDSSAYDGSSPLHSDSDGADSKFSSESYGSKFHWVPSADDPEKLVPIVTPSDDTRQAGGSVTQQSNKKSTKRKKSSPAREMNNKRRKPNSKKGRKQQKTLTPFFKAHGNLLRKQRSGLVGASDKNSVHSGSTSTSKSSKTTSKHQRDSKKGKRTAGRMKVTPDPQKGVEMAEKRCQNVYPDPSFEELYDSSDSGDSAGTATETEESEDNSDLSSFTVSSEDLTSQSNNSAQVSSQDFYIDSSSTSPGTWRDDSAATSCVQASNSNSASGNCTKNVNRDRSSDCGSHNSKTTQIKGDTQASNSGFYDMNHKTDIKCEITSGSPFLATSSRTPAAAYDVDGSGTEQEKGEQLSGEHLSGDMRLQQLAPNHDDSDDCKECLLLIPENHSALSDKLEEEKTKLVEEFGVDLKHVHTWSDLHPADLLPSDCMIYYFHDIARTMMQQKWKEFRMLLLSGRTIVERLNYNYSEGTPSLTKRPSQQRGGRGGPPSQSGEQRIILSTRQEITADSSMVDLYKEEIKKYLDKARIRCEYMIGMYPRSSGDARYLLLCITHICDREQKLRGAIHYSTLFSVDHSSVPQAAFKLFSSNHCCKYMHLECKSLLMWFRKNFPQGQYKVVSVPEEDIFKLDPDEHSAAFDELRTCLEGSGSQASDVPAVVFIGRINRSLIHFTNYLQACLSRYSSYSGKLHTACVFPVGNLDGKAFPRIQLDSPGGTVRFFTAFDPS